MSSRSNICTWRVLYRRQPFGNPERSGAFFPTENIRGKREQVCYQRMKTVKADAGWRRPGGSLGLGAGITTGEGCTPPGAEADTWARTSRRLETQAPGVGTTLSHVPLLFRTSFKFTPKVTS